MLLNDDKVLVIFGKIITQKRKMGIRAIQIYKQSNNDNDNENCTLPCLAERIPT